jgi:hypothetical protein
MEDFMKTYGEYFLIEHTDSTYTIYKKQSKEIVCVINKQNNNLLQIRDINGKVYLENILYVKCITDFDSFDFQPSTPGTYYPYSQNVEDYIPNEQLACFNGNDLLYFNLRNFKSSIRYEMVTQEVFLLDNCGINRKKVYIMLSRYKKEGKEREVQKFIEDCWNKNIRLIAYSPEKRSEWGFFLRNCLELEKRYPEYEVPELHSFYGYAFNVNKLSPVSTI